MMQQKVLGAVGLGGMGNQNTNMPLQGNTGNTTGQTIVNEVLKVLNERTSSQNQNPNASFSMGSMQNFGAKTSSFLSSMNSSDSQTSKPSTSLFSSQKRCDFNCASCQNQSQGHNQSSKSSNELYPGATPPPNIQSLIGAFGDLNSNSRIQGFQDNNNNNNSFSSALGKSGMSQFSSYGNTPKDPMGRGSSFSFAGSNGGSSTMSSYPGYPQMTEPRYPSPFASKPGFGFSQQGSPAMGGQGMSQFPKPRWGSPQQQGPRMPTNHPPMPTPPAFHFKNIRNRF